MNLNFLYLLSNLNVMVKEKFLTLLLALFVSMAAFAQNVTYSGSVLDQQGEPIIGASVVVKGSTTGSVTDLDGNFTLVAAPNATLEISYVGYKTQSLKGAKDMRVVLEEDAEMLNDVVVIGYGVQKKSVVTASIAKVSADDLAGKGAVRMDNALKGLAAGVNVTSNSGQPGEGSRIRIRGTGTINYNDPLYIVDGMPISGGLDIVNPNDIESIEVLKDAASGAIYGARAANGVILVTTKKGKIGKPQINYNFSYGWQNAWKKRDVTSAVDYAVLQNEYALASGSAPKFDPSNLVDSNGNPIQGFGTDWQDLVFNDNAPVVNHDVTVSGATEKLNYYLSMGYFTQDGIVGGNYGQSNYDKLTLRSNTNYNILDAEKERTFLNKVDLNVNVSYIRTHSTGIDTNSEYGSILGSALYLAPTLAPVATGDVAQGMKDAYEQGGKYQLITDGAGNPYTIPGYFGTYQEMNNPLAMLSLNPTRNWSHHFMAKFGFDVQLWDNLKYHFNYNSDFSFWGNEGATLSKYRLSGNNQAEHTSASVYKAQNNQWQVENTLTYDKTFGKHSIAVVLGQSALKEKGDDLSAWRWNIVNIDKPYFNYTTPVMEWNDDHTDVQVPYGVGGGVWTEHHLASYFGRLSYNYDERYMFQGTIRRDGSSRFGPSYKWGTFPSFSLGWNVTNEPYFQKAKEAAKLSNLKVRFSWGKNGNEEIGNFAYTVLTAMGNNVFFGNPVTKQSGSKATAIPNPDLKWEESEQTDLGLDLGFFNNKLTFTVDYFIKKTNGMIITMPIPSYVGETKPLGNVGDMENSGVEFELGYKWNIADAHFSVKANASYLKNKLKNLGNDTGFQNYDTVQGISGGGTRAENGKPFPFFYGYKTNGIFQTWDEVNAYVKDGKLIQPNAQPGDVRFVDLDGDGAITDDDRTDIGNGTPDWTFGLNLNADWKGFDFNMFLQGVSGADIFDATYRTDVFSGNYPAWMLSRWTGPGTSNKIPRMGANTNNNQNMSDLYVYDGSYLRLKNISLGYTIPEHITKFAGISRFRVYVMAENLFTWTKYHGFDPEIGSGGTSLGIDKGVYPQARTWTIGFNLSL